MRGATGCVAAAFLAAMTAIGNAETKIDLQLRPVLALTATDTSTDLPARVDDVPVGTTFYMELWMKDVGSAPYGISGGYLNIAYDTDKFDALAVNHGGLYNSLMFGTIDDPAGLVKDGLGGSYLGQETPGKDGWARLGWIDFKRTAAGQGAFVPQPPGIDEFSRFSGGGVNWSDVNAPTVRMSEVPEPTSIVLLTTLIALVSTVWMRNTAMRR